MPLTQADLDHDALEIVEHLQAAGHTAYLVGGCVRDLLLGRTPKDFDIGTGASPEAVKALFGRRCRIIGRRFTLAQVRGGGKIFEVATFRGPPDSQETASDDSGFVVRANTYGTAREDAHSRDFTVNGLFYDPVSDEVIDFVGGREDLAARRLVTIGGAEQRLREDPVRLLRAVKFAARLDFEIDEPIRACAHEIAPLLDDCPAARVTEEIFRILESGRMGPALELMDALGLLATVLPEIADHVADEGRARLYWRWVEQVDRLHAAHGTLPRESVFVLVWWPLIWAKITSLARAEQADWGRVVIETAGETAKRMGVPVRYRHQLRVTAMVLRRLMGAPHRHRPTPRLLQTPALPLALTVLRVSYLCGDETREAYERWAGFARSAGIWAAPFEPRSWEVPQGSSSEPSTRGGARRTCSRRRPPT